MTGSGEWGGNAHAPDFAVKLLGHLEHCSQCSPHI